MTYDVLFLLSRDVKENMRFLHVFYILYRLISKFVHTLTGPILCQNNVIYVTMATKYPIIKHRAFFKTLIFFIFPQIMKIYMSEILTRHL